VVRGIPLTEHDLELGARLAAKLRQTACADDPWQSICSMDRGPTLPGFRLSERSAYRFRGAWNVKLPLPRHPGKAAVCQDSAPAPWCAAAVHAASARAPRRSHGPRQ
jgi:hypothetical protein